MALNQRLSVAARNAGINAILALIGSGGFLRIYDGTQPTDPDTALGAQVKLSQHNLSATAFASASAGSAAANAIADDTAADATGTATWATFVTSAGTRIFDCSVGTSSANIILNSVAIQVNALVQITGYNFSIPMQGS